MRDQRTSTRVGLDNGNSIQLGYFEMNRMAGTGDLIEKRLPSRNDADCAESLQPSCQASFF